MEKGGNMDARILVVYTGHDADRMIVRHGLHDDGYHVDMIHIKKFNLFHLLSRQGGAVYDAVIFMRGDGLDELACTAYVTSLTASPMRVACFVIEAQGSYDLVGSVRYLQAGASDVLMRPIPLPSLLARLANEVYRRHINDGAVTLARAAKEEFVLNEDALNMDMDGRKVSLSRMEYRMMDIFIRHAGEVLDKNDLLLRLYQHPLPADCRIIDVYVCRLRKKLAEHGHGDVIRTVWGRGYCFAPTMAMN